MLHIIEFRKEKHQFSSSEKTTCCFFHFVLRKHHSFNSEIFDFSLQRKRQPNIFSVVQWNENELFSRYNWFSTFCNIISIMRQRLMLWSDVIHTFMLIAQSHAQTRINTASPEAKRWYSKNNYPLRSYGCGSDFLDSNIIVGIVIDMFRFAFTFHRTNREGPVHVACFRQNTRVSEKSVLPTYFGVCSNSSGFEIVRFEFCMRHCEKQISFQCNCK